MPITAPTSTPNPDEVRKPNTEVIDPTQVPLLATAAKVASTAVSTACCCWWFIFDNGLCHTHKMTIEDIEQLSGDALDKAVSEIEGGPFRAYSTDKEAAKVIIDREQIITTECEADPRNVFRWVAYAFAFRDIITTFAGGQTRLEAAMRVRVKQHRYDHFHDGQG